MALSGFEIATGGITSIPVTATLIFLSYKAFGEKNLDTTKYKPKKPAQTKKAEPSKEISESKKMMFLKRMQIKLRARQGKNQQQLRKALLTKLLTLRSQ